MNTNRNLTIDARNLILRGFEVDTCDWPSSVKYRDWPSSGKELEDAKTKAADAIHGALNSMSDAGLIALVAQMTEGYRHNLQDAIEDLGYGVMTLAGFSAGSSGCNMSLSYRPRA